MKIPTAKISSFYVLLSFHTVYPHFIKSFDTVSSGLFIIKLLRYELYKWIMWKPNWTAGLREL